MTRDLRKYARQTNFRLLAGFILLLFIVGDTLIFFIYGREAALLGFLCLLAGIFPLALIALVLWGMERILDRRESD